MANKVRTVFVCQSCASESPKWLGRCPSCGEYNTFVEERAAHPAVSSSRTIRPAERAAVKPVVLREMSASGRLPDRVSTGSTEFDRVLGGGLVPGEVVLLGGEPGIGKSTLVMQTADRLSRESRVCYVTGEESVEQLRLRAERLNLAHRNFSILNETDLDNIRSVLESEKPAFVIVDSIQTMYHPGLQSAAGSVGQIREVTRFLVDYAKGSGVTVFVIGHITKDGTLAGPKVLEHMVDCVLTFEGETHSSFRILRTAKNRYGATHEIGVFEMRDSGLAEVEDASAVFLERDEPEAPGSALTVLLEGTRPLVVEVQALSAFSAMAVPRRVAGGLDYNRLSLIVAVLDKMTGSRLRNQEIYARVSGGIRVEEPAVDLAVAVAVLSSFFNVPVGRDTVFIGEVGLNGFVRPVRGIDRRLAEAARLGFRTAVIAAQALPKGGAAPVPGMACRTVRDIRDIVKTYFSTPGASTCSD